MQFSYTKAIISFRQVVAKKKSRELAPLFMYTIQVWVSLIISSGRHPDAFRCVLLLFSGEDKIRCGQKHEQL